MKFNKSFNNLSTQAGESQLGLIVGALIVGCVIAVGSFVTQFMSDTKDERAHKTHDYFRNIHKVEPEPPKRDLKGYSVVIK